MLPLVLQPPNLQVPPLFLFPTLVFGRYQKTSRAVSQSELLKCFSSEASAVPLSLAATLRLWLGGDSEPTARRGIASPVQPAP